MSLQLHILPQIRILISRLALMSEISSSSSVAQGRCQNNPLIKLWLLYSTSFPIHSPLMILSFDTIQCKALIVLLNEPQREDYPRFNVHTTVLLKTEVFWDVIPCQLVMRYEHFESITFFQIVDNYKST